MGNYPEKPVFRSATGRSCLSRIWSTIPIIHRGTKPMPMLLSWNQEKGCWLNRKTLEKRWNEALAALENTRSQYAEYQQKNILKVTAQQKDKILALATNLPDLWNAATTSAKDRKRILRLLIKDITIEKIRG